MSYFINIPISELCEVVLLFYHHISSVIESYSLKTTIILLIIQHNDRPRHPDLHEAVHTVALCEKK